MSYYNPNAPIFGDNIPNVLQLYKSTFVPFPIDLTPGDFIVVTGADANNNFNAPFSFPAPGSVQYDGLSPALFLISFAVSGLLDTTSAAINFSVWIDGVENDASNINSHFDQQYKMVSNSFYALLNTGDHVNLRALLFSTVLPDTLNLETILITFQKV